MRVHLGSREQGAQRGDAANDLLDVDPVRELDLGVGDDPYKGDWASGRRKRWDLLGFNSRMWAGLKATAVKSAVTQRSALWHAGVARDRAPRKLSQVANPERAHQSSMPTGAASKTSVCITSRNHRFGARLAATISSSQVAIPNATTDIAPAFATAATPGQ